MYIPGTNIVSYRERRNIPNIFHSITNLRYVEKYIQLSIIIWHISSWTRVKSADLFRLPLGTQVKLSRKGLIQERQANFISAQKNVPTIPRSSNLKVIQITGCKMNNLKTSESVNQTITQSQRERQRTPFWGIKNPHFCQMPRMAFQFFVQQLQPHRNNPPLFL